MNQQLPSKRSAALNPDRSMRRLSQRQRLSIAVVAVSGLLGFLWLYERVTGNPSWVSNRTQLANCGRVDLPGAQARLVLAVQACILDAQRARSGGEAVIVIPETSPAGATVELLTIVRVLPEGKAELLEKRTKPNGEKEWTQRLCDRLVDSGDLLVCG